MLTNSSEVVMPDFPDYPVTPGRPDSPFDEFPDDLPDLETLVWKLVHAIQDCRPIHLLELEDDEGEYVAHVLEAQCPICSGTGQSSLTREGAPIECKTCNGRGR